MTRPGDAFEAAIAIARALEHGGVSYAIGGAHAYGQYGVPRATNDVDVNVFVDATRLAPVFAALRALEIPLDEGVCRTRAENEGMFVTRYGDFRVDVFIASIAFSREAERSRVQRTIDGEPVWFLSAEALCVFKLLFFRSKDLVDLERLIAVYGAQLDAGYVRDRVAEMLSEDDPRIETWDRLWREHRP